MLEIKVKIEATAPDLSAAIVKLAEAVAGKAMIPAAPAATVVPTETSALAIAESAPSVQQNAPAAPEAPVMQAPVTPAAPAMTAASAPAAPIPTPTPEVPAATPTPAPVIEQSPSGVNVEVKTGTYTTTSDVNLRSDCSTDGDIVQGVAAGTVLNSTGVCENGWIRVDWEGQTVYASGDYVTLNEESASQEAAAGEGTGEAPADGSAEDGELTDGASASAEELTGDQLMV